VLKMQIRNFLIASTLAIGCAGAVGCTKQPETTPEVAVDDPKLQVTDEKKPQVIEQSSAALPTCEAEAPAICAGPVIAKVENVTLQWLGAPNNIGDRRVTGTATVTLQSRVTEPVQVALLNDEIALKFANGTTLTNRGNSSQVSGLEFCGRDGVRCVNNQYKPFTTITPGDSPLRVEFKFEDQLSAQEIPSLAGATTASISMSLWGIHTDPAGNRLTVSIGNAPVANSTVE
jgi:hypothetical protein